MKRSMMVLAAALLALLVPGPARAGVTKGRPLETGETTNYGPGSDGDLRMGLSRMFNDLGNGVVKDQRTGLFWEKKSNDGSIHDKDDTYTWGQDGSPYAMNGTMVTTFLATLNTAPCFAGYCDWRIPNLAELDTLTSVKEILPAFATGCKAGCSVTTCSCTGSDVYWSSSTTSSEPARAAVEYIGGDVAGFLKTTAHSVRAVRGGS